MSKKTNESESAPETPTPANSVEIIMVINVLLALIEQLVPKITQWANEGNITTEEQEAIRARYDALTADMDAAFGGTHWRVRPN